MTTETETEVPDLDDFELEQTANGEYCCPVDSCSGTSKTARGVSIHYGTMRSKGYEDHDSILVLELVSEEEWKAYLRDQVYNQRQTNYKDVAATLPDHIGRTLVRKSMSEYEISVVSPTQGAVQILSTLEVTSIEEAREHSKKYDHAEND